MKNTRFSLERQYEGYLFLLPWFVGVLLLASLPLLTSFYHSFTVYDLFSSPRFIGLFNYKQLLFEDTRFHKSMQVTAAYVGIGVPLQLLFALCVALALSKGTLLLRTLRGVYYLPALLGNSVAIGILWKQLFGLKGGHISNALQST
ncbi:MAG: sugar ABC transporter permease [bacterium]|nr:sugar ABC transporter permease [bacterium]